MMGWFLRRFKAFRKLEAELSLAKLDMLRYQGGWENAGKCVAEMKVEALKSKAELTEGRSYCAQMESRVASLLDMIHDHENTIGQLQQKGKKMEADVTYYESAMKARMEELASIIRDKDLAIEQLNVRLNMQAEEAVRHAYLVDRLHPDHEKLMGQLRAILNNKKPTRAKKSTKATKPA